MVTLKVWCLQIDPPPLAFHPRPLQCSYAALVCQLWGICKSVLSYQGDTLGQLGRVGSFGDPKTGWYEVRPHGCVAIVSLRRNSLALR